MGYGRASPRQEAFDSAGPRSERPADFRTATFPFGFDLSPSGTLGRAPDLAKGRSFHRGFGIAPQPAAKRRSQTRAHSRSAQRGESSFVPHGRGRQAAQRALEP